MPDHFLLVQSLLLISMSLGVRGITHHLERWQMETSRRAVPLRAGRPHTPGKPVPRPRPGPAGQTAGAAGQSPRAPTPASVLGPARRLCSPRGSSDQRGQRSKRTTKRPAGAGCHTPRGAPKASGPLLASRPPVEQEPSQRPESVGICPDPKADDAGKLDPSGPPSSAGSGRALHEGGGPNDIGRTHRMGSKSESSDTSPQKPFAEPFSWGGLRSAGSGAARGQRGAGQGAGTCE